MNSFVRIAMLFLLSFSTPACDSDSDGGNDDPSNDDDATQPNDDDDDDGPINTIDPCPVDDPECVDWRYITDEQGRALFFHGMNIDGQAKHEAGLPIISYEEAVELNEVHGMNFARYLTFWSMIEPEKGVYDESYLDQVEERLDWFAEIGITVVIDMHQDCWSETDIIYPGSHGNNGAPGWATVTDGEPHTQPPGMWSLCYLSKDVSRAFDNFWDYEKHPELQDHYAAMWAHVVGRFKDHPAVLGYDFMNEPWEGSYMTDPETFDQTLFPAFYQRMIDAVRAVDPDGWIFYEPRAFGPNQAAPSYLSLLTDPREGDQRLAYFPHFYPLAYESGYLPGEDGYIERWRDHRVNEMEMQRAPLLSGEWSTLPFASEEIKEMYFVRMHDMFDQISSGWAFWDRGVANGVGGIEDGAVVMELLTRPYPRVVAGQPIEYGFDEDTKIMTLVFESRGKVTGNTEIFIPVDQHYPGGWALESDDPDGSYTESWNPNKQALSVGTDSSIPTHVLRIVPAP